MNKRARGICIIVGCVVALAGWLLFAYAHDLGFAKAKAVYRGSLLPIEDGEAYTAVTVLVPTHQLSSFSRANGAQVRVYGEPDMLAADGKPIEAGDVYRAGQFLTGKGLRLIIPHQKK